MATRLIAFIEFGNWIPFTDLDYFSIPQMNEESGVIPLEEYLELRACKDYRFFSLISGWILDDTVNYTLSPKSLPKNLHPKVQKYFNELSSESGVYGYATLSEIESIIQENEYKDINFSFHVQVLLGFLRLVGNSLGNNNVRLVFELS